MFRTCLAWSLGHGLYVWGLLHKFWALKRKIHDLIDEGHPEVESLFQEGKQGIEEHLESINLISTDDEACHIFDVDTLPMSLVEMFIHLRKAGYLRDFKGSEPEIRDEIQKFIDTGVIRTGREEDNLCAVIRNEGRDTIEHRLTKIEQSIDNLAVNKGDKSLIITVSRIKRLSRFIYPNFGNPSPKECPNFEDCQGPKLV
ncbi:hypothetical protein CDL15_Pgr014981 [Punica granatum]|uniref:Uncharacterized protein n=1 Tax=Punica granatum TaxID=22663 RepID=A0A218X1E3_PUNGR|nr:hypothetical protein CDL15_Pgr014981 [Punica granatum]